MIWYRCGAVVLGMAVRRQGGRVERIRRFNPRIHAKIFAQHGLEPPDLTLWRVTWSYPPGSLFARATVFAESMVEALGKIRGGFLWK